jgi:hypothetical protein
MNFLLPKYFRQKYWNKNFDFDSNYRGIRAEKGPQHWFLEKNANLLPKLVFITLAPGRSSYDGFLNTDQGLPDFSWSQHTKT